MKECVCRYAMVSLLLAGLAGSALRADSIIPANVNTPIGPGFNLGFKDPGPPSLPGVIVALDPASCGAACPAPSLDLTNPGNPVLIDPGPQQDQSFSILWGMKDPGPIGDVFSYNLPGSAPDANGNYFWSATESTPAGALVASY